MTQLSQALDRFPIPTMAVGATTSVGGAALSWLEQAQLWLSLIATVIAILSGLVALAVGLRQLRRKPVPIEIPKKPGSNQ